LKLFFWTQALLKQRAQLISLLFLEIGIPSRLRSVPAKERSFCIEARLVLM